MAMVRSGNVTRGRAPRPAPIKFDLSSAKLGTQFGEFNSKSGRKAYDLRKQGDPGLSFVGFLIGHSIAQAKDGGTIYNALVQATEKYSGKNTHNLSVRACDNPEADKNSRTYSAVGEVTITNNIFRVSVYTKGDESNAYVNMVLSPGFGKLVVVSGVTAKPYTPTHLGKQFHEISSNAKSVAFAPFVDQMDQIACGVENYVGCLMPRLIFPEPSFIVPPTGVPKPKTEPTEVQLQLQPASDSKAGANQAPQATSDKKTKPQPSAEEKKYKSAAIREACRKTHSQSSYGESIFAVFPTPERASYYEQLIKSVLGPTAEIHFNRLKASKTTWDVNNKCLPRSASDFYARQKSDDTDGESAASLYSQLIMAMEVLVSWEVGGFQQIRSFTLAVDGPTAFKSDVQKQEHRDFLCSLIGSSMPFAKKVLETMLDHLDVYAWAFCDPETPTTKFNPSNPFSPTYTVRATGQAWKSNYAWVVLEKFGIPISPRMATELLKSQWSDGKRSSVTVQANNITGEVTAVRMRLTKDVLKKQFAPLLSEKILTELDIQRLTENVAGNRLFYDPTDDSFEKPQDSPSEKYLMGNPGIFPLSCYGFRIDDWPAYSDERLFFLASCIELSPEFHKRIREHAEEHGDKSATDITAQLLTTEYEKLTDDLRAWHDLAFSGSLGQSFTDIAKDAYIVYEIRKADIPEIRKYGKPERPETINTCPFVVGLGAPGSYKTPLDIHYAAASGKPVTFSQVEEFYADVIAKFNPSEPSTNALDYFMGILADDLELAEGNTDGSNHTAAQEAPSQKSGSSKPGDNGTNPSSGEINTPAKETPPKSGSSGEQSKHLESRDGSTHTGNDNDGGEEGDQGDHNNGERGDTRRELDNGDNDADMVNYNDRDDYEESQKSDHGEEYDAPPPLRTHAADRTNRKAGSAQSNANAALARVLGKRARGPKESSTTKSNNIPTLTTSTTNANPSKKHRN